MRSPSRALVSAAGFRGGHRHPAGVGVLHNHGGRLLGWMFAACSITELSNRGQGRFQVQKIVGAQFLALQLDGTTPACFAWLYQQAI